MEVLTRWFVENYSLAELREQCPFVNTYSEEYLRCFNNTYTVDEFDWIRYARDNPKLHIQDELTAYSVWMRTGRTGAYVFGSESVFNGFPWSAYLQSNHDLTNANIKCELAAYGHWIHYGRRENRIVVRRNIIRDKFLHKIMKSCITQNVLVKEFDWRRYLTDSPTLNQSNVMDELSTYNAWMSSGKTCGFVLGTNEQYRGFPWCNYFTRNVGLDIFQNELEFYSHWITYGRMENYKCWDVEYSVLEKCDIFKRDEFNEALLNTMMTCIRYNAYDPGINISIIDATMQRIINYEKNSIFMCKNKKIVMVMASRLDITAGDTIMCANWMNKLMKEHNHITLLSIYQIGPTFTRNLIYDNYICKTLNHNALLMKELDNIMQNMDIALVRNSELLPSLKKKNYLHKIILYGLDQHLDGITDMNNKFHTVITQSEQLKEKYVKNGVLPDKIEVVEPFSYKYEFQLQHRNDNEIRLIYCGTLRDEENILELINEFQKIHAYRPNVILKMVYGKIHGNMQFTQKVNNYIKNGVDGITFKYNLSHRDSCYEIATSDIGICWRKKGWGDNGEISTKKKEYQLYDKRVCDISPALFKL